MPDHFVDANKKVCRHHWIMDPIPNDGQRHPTSTGRCKTCGAVREFANVMQITAADMYAMGRDRPQETTYAPTYQVDFSQHAGRPRGQGRPQAEQGIVRGRG